MLDINKMPKMAGILITTRKSVFGDTKGLGIKKLSAMYSSHDAPMFSLTAMIRDA
jgi:hypothetical protein